MPMAIGNILRLDVRQRIQRAEPAFDQARWR